MFTKVASIDHDQCLSRFKRLSVRRHQQIQLNSDADAIVDTVNVEIFDAIKFRAL